MIEWFQLGVAILSLIAVAVVIPIANSVRNLKSNELHAIRGDIEAVRATLIREMAALHSRVDSSVHRMDVHIQWHLNQAMKVPQQEGP